MHVPMIASHASVFENGGVKGGDMSAEELDRETGEEQMTVDWTRRKEGG